MRFPTQSEIALLTLFGTAYLLFYPPSAIAQKLPKPLFKTAPAERKILVEEIKHEYYVRKYSPPVKVKFVTKKKECSYYTPEEVVIASISAMAAVDLEWEDSCWDKESLKFTAAHMKSINLTPKLIKKAWRETFKDRQFKLITRVDFRGGVVIDVKRIAESKAETEALTFDFAFKKQPDGTWKRTQEFRAHTLRLFWSAPEEKVKRTIKYEP